MVFSFNLCLDTRFDCKSRGNFILQKKPIVATAVDPLTVTFRLAEPFHSFPWAIANVFIVPAATFEGVSKDEKEFRRGGRRATTRAEIPARFRALLCRIAGHAGGGPGPQ